jgi:hypothetical protein
MNSSLPIFNLGPLGLDFEPQQFFDDLIQKQAVLGPLPKSIPLQAKLPLHLAGKRAGLLEEQAVQDHEGGSLAVPEAVGHRDCVLQADLAQDQGEVVLYLGDRPGTRVHCYLRVLL